MVAIIGKLGGKQVARRFEAREKARDWAISTILDQKYPELGREWHLLYERDLDVVRLPDGTFAYTLKPGRAFDREGFALEARNAS